MEQIIQCTRCRENYLRKRPSRMGICPWCEEGLIATERELSRKCGLQPMTHQGVFNLNKYCGRKNLNESF